MSAHGKRRHPISGKHEMLETCSSVKSLKRTLVQKPSLICMRRHFSITEEVIFKVPGSLRIHPFLWSKEDVIHWLRWAEEEYSLQRTDDSKFVMNGRGLCILTKSDFKNRSPSSGDVLYELLSCIKTHRKSLLSHPFFRHSMRQMDQEKINVCINSSAATSHTSNITTMLSSISDINHYQDGPLNLSNRVRKDQDEEIVCYMENVDHDNGSKSDF
ncbi:transcription factor ETV7 [Pelobates cultripes]|uniref:Transcription factor ETV7 n=1 Tax=Pelobates cultripes TaxID=61616 RepID=A0AAD1QZA8_PELCU|nr:transcription factor ETV7 [Pelobates cultripes]